MMVFFRSQSVSAEVVVADVCHRHSQACFTLASSAKNLALSSREGQHEERNATFADVTR